MQFTTAHLRQGQTLISEKYHTLFELSVKQFPENTALIFKEESLSYKTLNEKADTLCQAILNWAYYDDVIGVSATPGPEMLIAVLAILKSGKAFLPINPLNIRAKNEQIISDASLNFCLCKAAEHPYFSSLQLKVIETDSDRQYPTITEKRLGKMAYLMYTSGSTSTAKGVRVDHKALVNYLINATDTYFSKEARYSGAYLQLPLSFDASLTALLSPLLCGKQVVMAETCQAACFNDPNFVKHMPYDVIKLTPLQFNWLEKAINSRPLPLSRYIVAGGENLHARHFAFLRHRGLETEIINEYGPTEATVGCMTHKMSLNDATEDSPAGIPIGTAMPGNDILILNKKMQPIGRGEIGEIYIGGQQLSAGYMMRPELNNSLFIPHPFRSGEKLFKTGDYATINEQGTAVYLDRAENHIETEGQRIDFNTIEWAISCIKGVKHCEVVVKSIQDKTRILAYVMPDGEGLDIDTLPISLSQLIPASWMPQKFIVISEWPYTLHGKLNKHALPVPHCSKHRQGNKRMPQTQLQKELAAVWCQLLNLPHSDIDTGFFEMGGNHILADQMIQILNKQYQYKIDLVLLYQCSSIACLASEIEKQMSEKRHSHTAFSYKEAGYSA